MTKTKRCNVCHEFKPLSEFNISMRKGSITYYRGRCRECQSAYNAYYRSQAISDSTMCEQCKFLEQCRKIVCGCLTRDVVIDGVSTRIYLDPYCFVTSPLFEEYKKVYRHRASEPAVGMPSNARY